MAAVANTLPKSWKYKIAGSVQTAELRRYVDRRLTGLRTDRWSYWQHWRQLSDFILPRRGRYLMTPNQATRGDPVGSRIINETPTLAARTLSAGLMAGLTSPARPWFRLSIRDMDVSDNTPVRLWLDEVTKRMLTVLSQSNAYNSLHVIYEELGVFGTGCVLIEEDYEDVIRCQTLTAGEYYVASSGRNQIDTLYREYVLAVGQIVERFGFEACSPVVQGLWKSGSLDKEIPVAQAIEPNDDRSPQVPGLKGRKFRSIIWELGKVAGFDPGTQGFHRAALLRAEMARDRKRLIRKRPGHGMPGGLEDAPAVREANRPGDRQDAKSADGRRCQMKNEPASFLPEASHTLPKLGPGTGFRPAYEVPPQITGAEEKIAKAEERIKSTFFADLFPDDKPARHGQDRNRDHRAEAGKDADARTFFGKEPV